MSRLGIAVLGAGLMGRWHATYARRAGVDVVVVADIDMERARFLASKYRAVALRPSDLDFWDERAIDSVHVCTPLDTHAAYVESALQARRHVVVEKPVAEDRATVLDLLDLAHRHGLLLTAVHQLPFQRGYRRLIDQRDRLGEIRRVVYRTHTAGAEGRSPDERRAVLLEILPHAASLFYGLGHTLGEAGSGVDSEAADGWHVDRFDDGALRMRSLRQETEWVIEIFLDLRPTLNELCVYGTQAAARVDLFHGYQVVDRAGTHRRGKVARPLALGAKTLTASLVNLGIRAFRRQPAYPGLPELIARHYESVLSAGPPVVAREQVLLAATLRRLVQQSDPSR